MFRLGSEIHLLEISAHIEEDKNLQSFEDAELDILVVSGTFQGNSSVWVDANTMRRFCKDLYALHKKLRGEARLESMSPNELSLKVFASNLRGGLAVEGVFGSHVHSDGRMFWHSVSFGFEFQPSDLEVVVRQPWVMRYAG